MNLVERRFGATGFKLPLWGCRQIEIWYCPKGCEIPDHTHPSIVSRLVFLAGRMVWRRDGKMKECRWWHALRSFAVPAKCVHGATTTGRFGLFLNFERWDSSVTKTSAAENLTLA